MLWVKKILLPTRNGGSNILSCPYQNIGEGYSTIIQAECGTCPALAVRMQGHLMSDHVPMLMSLSPKMSVSSLMKECTDDVRQACKFEIQVWQPALLGGRVLSEATIQVHTRAGAASHHTTQAKRKGV